MEGRWTGERSAGREEVGGMGVSLRWSFGRTGREDIGGLVVGCSSKAETSLW